LKSKKNNSINEKQLGDLPEIKRSQKKTDAIKTNTVHLHHHNNRLPPKLNLNVMDEHCSQMRSYDEAEFFVRNCPNTKMDGDNDGVPCERQFGR
jgi:hypothetical protein